MRVVLAEDLALLRDGMIRLLTAYDLEVVAAVADAPELERALTENAADIAIVDVRLPPSFTNEGLVAAIKARQTRQGFPVLVLSQYVETVYARELLADGQGAIGYLLKDRVTDVEQFIADVYAVAGGATVLDPHVVGSLMTRAADQNVPLARLSPREREVLSLMAEGRSNAAIAQRLVVTEKAIGKHTNAIFTKLDLPVAADDNRRVRAVLAWLDAQV